jgi:hypothetical protein
LAHYFCLAHYLFVLIFDEKSRTDQWALAGLPSSR